MKKTILIMCIGLLLTGLLISCVSNPGQNPSDVPKFYLNPPQADDAVYGVGSAKMAKLDTSRKMAIARAREDIAFQVSTTVKASITDYAQEAGADGGNQVLQFIETVSKQITQTKLNGTVIEDVYVARDGIVYALIKYPLRNFLQDAESEFIRNEDAAFAEFKADEAVRRLEAELADNPPTSNPVSK